MLNAPCSRQFPEVDPPVVPPNDGTGVGEDNDGSSHSEGDGGDNGDDGDSDEGPVSSTGSNTGDTQNGSSSDGPTQEENGQGITIGGGGQSLQSAGSCFPRDALVTMVDGLKLRMNSVCIGDIVLARSGQYSRVIGFTHAEPIGVNNFVRVTTNTGHVIRLSDGHFIYASGGVVRARDVRIGDTVILGSGGTAKVKAVEASSGVGLYNPQTICGDVVVDGVVSTTYTEMVCLGMGHALLLPLRAVARIYHDEFVWSMVGDLLMSVAETWHSLV